MNSRPPIHVWGYLDEFEQEKEEILAGILKVLRSGRLILGESVRRFEEEFSHWCGATHGIGVANGTDAIFLALKALGIQSGDEVVTVANTAVPTASAIVAAGGIPRFVDIDPATGLINPERIAGVISPRTRFLLPVHLYGQCVDMKFLQRIAQEHQLQIIEDCAQAHGAECQGQKAGSFGDAATFSFYPTKNLGTYGDGGMVLTSRDDIAEKLRRLRFYGMEKQYFSLEDGYNSRLDELHAEILLRKFQHLDHYIERRRHLADLYNRELADTPLTLPKTAPGNRHAWHLYVVRHPQRDLLLQRLKDHNIHAGIHYPWPLHKMPPFERFVRHGDDLSETERAAGEVLSLPMYPALKDEDVLVVCGTIKEIFSNL